MDVDELKKLGQYCKSPSDHARLCEYLTMGSYRAAAKRLMINESSMRRTINRLKASAAAGSSSEPVKTTPPPCRAKVHRQPDILPLMNPRRSVPISDSVSHLIIPDTQLKYGASMAPLKWIAEYAVEKRPTRIIHLGDNWDMPSLGFWDRGKLRGEGARVLEDILAGNLGIETFEETIRRLAPGYNPDMHFMIGNHENRINRYIQDNPNMLGKVGIQDLALSNWNVHEFLRPVTLEGVQYAHYFCRNAKGKVVQSKNGMPSAQAQVIREGMSTVAGHKQGIEIHPQTYQDKTQWGIIAGSCYLHDEEYLSPQYENYWRGILMFNGVKDGEMSIRPIDLDWLCQKSEGKTLKDFLETATRKELMICGDL